MTSPACRLLAAVLCVGASAPWSTPAAAQATADEAPTAIQPRTDDDPSAADRSPPEVTLPRVVITASRTPTLETDAPASLTVITRREIEARGADNVLAAVRGETGLSLQGRAVGGRKVLSIRGLDARHTLFLINGQRISASDGVIGASDYQYDWIAVDDIVRIEVVRGPLSVLYGSEALGGVVNIITREPGDAWRFAASAEGSFTDDGRGGDGHRLSLQADGPLAAGFVLRAGAAASRVESLASPVDPRLSELEGRDKRDGWIGLGWRGGAGHRIDLQHRAGQEERDALARERGGARRYHQSVNLIDRETTSLDWQADWATPWAGQPLATQLRAYRSMIDAENRRTAGVAVNPPQRIEDQVLEGQARLPLTEHALLLGFEARNNTLADPGLPGGRSLAQYRSLFAQDEFTILPALTLTAGLRHDDHSLYGDHWSPRAYLVWRLDEQWTVKGGASHGFMAPNLKQIVPGARAEGPNTFIGNPALRPETSNSVEFGAGFAAGGAQAQVMLFAQRVHDLIDIRLIAAGSVPGTGTYTYENLAEARLRGVEGAWTQAIGSGFSAGITYTYLDAYSGTGARLERRPRHSAAARLDWQQGPWRAGLRLEHSGEQVLPSPSVGAPSQPVPEVTLIGGHVGYAFSPQLEAMLGAHNLGDVRLADKSLLFTQVEQPRTWRLGLRLRW